jgi:hypothetical protein
MNLVQLPRRKATRDEHMARWRRAQQLLVEHAEHPVEATRIMAEEFGVQPRQAHRYMRAARMVFARELQRSPATTPQEMIAILQHKAHACVQGDDPDWKASVKALELICRLNGWLDRKSTVTVQGSVTVEHMPALAGASDEEIAALQAFHDARQRRLAAEAPQPVGMLGELADDANSGVVGSSPSMPMVR